MVSGNGGFEPWAVLLAGGIGSRFWPASTPNRPKQFLPLASSQPLIRDTLERARAVASPSNVLIVAGRHLEALIGEYLPDFARANLLIEPQARGTAAALAWAAQEIISRSSNPERAVMIAMPSDHVIHPPSSFAATIKTAVEAAGRTGRLLTIGVPPSRPETGYGYIQVVKPASAPQPQPTEVFEVTRFVEKPDLATAQDYVADGEHFWNSGIFVWRPHVLLDELTAHTPEIASEMHRLESGDTTGFFAAIPPNLTIDYGLLERSSNVAVVEAQFEWDDVGAWGALLRVRDTDPDGNLVVGDVEAYECGDSVLWADDGPIVGWGLDKMIIARASGITFVAPLEHAADLKRLLDRLPDRLKLGDG